MRESAEVSLASCNVRRRYSGENPALYALPHTSPLTETRALEHSTELKGMFLHMQKHSPIIMNLEMLLNTLQKSAFGCIPSIEP